MEAIGDGAQKGSEVVAAGLVQHMMQLHSKIHLLSVLRNRAAEQDGLEGRPYLLLQATCHNGIALHAKNLPMQCYTGIGLCLTAFLW